MLKNVKTATILVVLLHASLAVAQTKAAKPSAVGVWKMDMKQSKFGSQPPPKSAMLTILKDTPDAMAWRYEKLTPQVSPPRCRGVDPSTAACKT